MLMGCRTRQRLAVGPAGPPPRPADQCSQPSSHKARVERMRGLLCDSHGVHGDKASSLLLLGLGGRLLLQVLRRAALLVRLRTESAWSQQVTRTRERGAVRGYGGSTAGVRRESRTYLDLGLGPAREVLVPAGRLVHRRAPVVLLPLQVLLLLPLKRLCSADARELALAKTETGKAAPRGPGCASCFRSARCVP
jgi:hypothetical protein